MMEGIEQDARAMERLAQSFELIAQTVEAWYNLEKRRFELEHPAKPAARDATVTAIPTGIEKLKQDQGATDESQEDWERLGPREREFLNRKPKNLSPSREAGTEPERGGSESD